MRGVLIAAVAALALAPAASAAPTGPLGQSGRWITDAKGRVVILHGVNMVNKVDAQGYAPAATGFGADDARFLAREGLNTVRLGVIYAAVEPQPGVYSDAYLSSIAQTVKTLADQNVFALLDFHQDMYNERFQGEGFPGWAVQDDGLPAQPQTGFPGNYVAQPALNRAFQHFWGNDPGPGGVGLQDRYAAAWRHVAERFRGERDLVGYDLFNEPWPGPQWPTCANTEGCPAFDAQLTEMSRRATTAIHTADPGHVAWYEPNVIFNDGAKTSHGDTGPNAGMSFHVYCLAEGDTPGPSPFDPEQETGCSTFEDLPFHNADAQSARTGDALLLSEFGATDDLGQIQRIIAAAERHMVSWQYWHYCQCADPTTSGVGPTQALVLDPNRPPTGDNVKTDKLRILSRAYPQAVAGTPRSYDFDPAKRTFALDYSTERAGGGGFTFGTDTQVFVPVRQYPQGYDVRVEGGEPVSAPNEQALRIRACSGRREVKVRVTPGAGALSADCRATRAGAARRKRLRIRLVARPPRVTTGRLTRFRFRATVRGRVLQGATVRFGRRRVRTNRRGRAVLRMRVHHSGRHRARVTKRGYRTGRATIRAKRRPR
jgi:endoglycosylceramidase